MKKLFFIGKFILISLFFTLKILFPASAQNEKKYFEEGNKYLDLKKYKEAVGSFTKAINKNDHTSDYYLRRGIAYCHLNEFQNSYNDLTSAIKYDYMNGEAYYYRGMILYTKNMYQEAVNDLDMAIKYPPNDSLLFRGYLMRGECKSAIMDFKGAFDDCKKYLQFDSCNREALNTMALAKNDMKQPEEALGYVNKILAQYPGDTISILNKGFINISLESWDTAFKYLSLAAKLNPKIAYTFSNLSYVKMKKGDLQGALKDVNHSLNLDPGNSWAYRNRGLIYKELKQNEKACDDFHMAIKKGFTERFGNEVSDLIYTNCIKK